MEDAVARANCSDALAGAMGRDRYDLWLADAAEVRFDKAQNAAGAVHVVFSSVFMCDNARRNVGAELQAAAKQVYGGETTIAFHVDDSASVPAPVALPSAKAVRSESAAGSPSTAQTVNAEPKAPTFESLVVGRSNQLAATAAKQLAVGRHAGGPLVVCGPPGCGKTHLLSAIKHAYRQSFRRRRVLSLTSEQFVGSYVQALRGGGLPSFRQKYRGADLLIVDDLHFMAGKRATLEELQHTIDRVQARGGQVVVASCHEPGKIANLSEELLSRLRAGLVCEVTTADYATRLEIARRRCAGLALPIDSTGLAQLASSVSSGARELLGAIERLRAQHELLGESIDSALIERTATAVNGQTIRPLAMGEIQKAVCDYFGVDAKTLRSTSRRKSITEPRMLAMWLTRKYTQAGWREIGDYFGGRSHSTVISAHRRIEQQMAGGSTAGDHACNRQLEDAVVQIETNLRLA